MEKILIILTSGYPFGIYDDFLHTEMQFTKKEFQKIYFVIPTETSKYKLRNLDFEYEISKVKKKSKVLFLFMKPLSVFFALKDIKKSNINFSIKALKISLDFQLNSFSYLKSIEDILKKEENKSIILYSYWFDFRTHAIKRLKLKNPFLHCITRAHGYDIYKERQALNYQPFKSSSDVLDKIFTISAIGKKYLIENYGINEEKIATSRLGVLKNKKNNIESDSFRILSCSNIIPLKRIDLIIESLSYLKNIEFEWIHIGEGEIKKSLIELATNKLSSNIKFSFVGELENRLVTQFYASYLPNLFINVSTTEGIPVSIMEAMSFGVPCIATNVGGTSEIVTNENGYLLSGNPSPEEVANIITTFYELSTHEKNKKSQNAFETWETKYNAEKNYSEFVNQLKSI